MEAPTTKLNYSTKPPAIICDLDGTLCNANSRKYLIEGKHKNWDKFYEMCDQDTCHTHIAVIINRLAPIYKIILATGRVEKVRAKTIKWLDNFYIFYDALLMRPNGDFRPDEILKEEMLDRDILPYFSPQFALDDRNKVVAMWRRHDIPCLQVAEGDF